MSAVVTVAELGDRADVPARLSGVVSQVTPMTTRQGRAWATAVLTDATGAVEVFVYPAVFALFGRLFTDGAEVTLSGRVDRVRTGYYVMVDQAQSGGTR